MSTTKTRLIAIGKRVYHSINHLSVSLTGRIPTELSHLTKLTWLELHTNQLTGEYNQGSPHCNGQRVYHSINHSSVSFTGRIPTELGHLTKLRQLQLHTNQLTGDYNQDSLDCNWSTGLAHNY